MKLQYLGDSKDSFKWDYHDFLISQLGYSIFKVVPMMTPDDGSTKGQSRPSLFPARPEVLDFCNGLRQSRLLNGIRMLPEKTGGNYYVDFHKPNIHLNHISRDSYFSGFNDSVNEMVFLDPDNGFEPEKSCSEKHARYKDITQILEQVSDDSVVSVFQHFRRMPFPKDFSRIRERIGSSFTTAIFWHSLMFVAVSESEKTIRKVFAANKKYAKTNPVEIIA